MVEVARGVIHGSNIILTEPLPLPEGAEVIIRIELANADRPDKPTLSLEEFKQLPCWGMWKDREDMANSEEWIRKERERWNQRLTKKD
ncbi:MAG: hypothetical protein AB1656_20490 [Candidatus Omnitrophota bacterium]